MTVPYYGRKDRDAFLRRWAEIVGESYGLHEGIMFERMIQDLYVDLEFADLSRLGTRFRVTGRRS